MKPIIGKAISAKSHPMDFSGSRFSSNKTTPTKQRLRIKRIAAAVPACVAAQRKISIPTVYQAAISRAPETNNPNGSVGS